MRMDSTRTMIGDGPRLLKPQVRRLQRQTIEAGVPVSQQHARTSAGVPDCPWEGLEFHFGDGYSSVCGIINDIHRAYPYFKVDDSGEMEWPTSLPELGEDSLLVIDLSDEFMYAEEVRGEMLAWMILHELGHLLADREPCNAGVLQSCEGAADYWAAATGLRKVYPDQQFIDVSKAAQQQMQAYQLSLYRTLDRCGTPSCGCEENPSCGYPPPRCRVSTIQLARCGLHSPSSTDKKRQAR